MRYVHTAAQAMLALLFTLMVIVGGMQVFNRFLLNSSLSWSEELQKFSFIWLVFFAIPVAYQRGSHLCVDALVERLPLRLRKGLAVAIDALWLALGLAFVLLTCRLMGVARFQQSAGLGISMAWAYSGMLAGGAYLALCAAVKLLSPRPAQERAP
ncbi:TRAP transporter small permease [Orrella sp. JC864]|uniref:TRAP transporter small permease n=1 Tax=Orrella sp. JC864 TaxID=3120298 RepID=UPI003008D5EF